MRSTKKSQARPLFPLAPRNRNASIVRITRAAPKVDEPLRSISRAGRVKLGDKRVDLVDWRSDDGGEPAP